MKTFSITLSIIAGLLILAVGYQFGRHRDGQTIPPQLTLEQVLSIRELHLVRHTYTDLFFLHKKNDNTKAIRAIIHVPVEMTAHLNLKNIALVKQGDSIQMVILPRATVSKPHYQMDNLTVRETRNFQVYGGPDLYAEVSRYLQTAIAERHTAVETIALSNKIALQAEEEGKEYIEYLLRCVGRPDIVVRFQED
jgi:hypothetical protein